MTETTAHEGEHCEQVLTQGFPLFLAPLFFDGSRVAGSRWWLAVDDDSEPVIGWVRHLIRDGAGEVVQEHLNPITPRGERTDLWKAAYGSDREEAREMARNMVSYVNWQERKSDQDGIAGKTP